MKKWIGLALILFTGFAFAKMAEEGFGYKSEKTQKTQELSTYQKWISFKAKVEKKVRVFLGVDKTEEIVQERLRVKEEKRQAFERQKQELVEQLPSFKQEDKGTSAEDYEKLSSDLKAKDLLPVVEQGAPADETLKKKAGVPVFDTETTKVVKSGKKTRTIKVKIDKIPVLNIGRESAISAADFDLPELRATLARRQDIKSLASPDMISDIQFLSWLDVKLDEVKYEPIKVVTLKSLGLNEKSINALQWYTREEVAISLKDMDRLSKDEYALVRALMIEAGKNCHASSGIFYNLSGSENPMVDKTAKYYLALCSHKMGLFHQSITRLINIVLSDFTKEAKTLALSTLFKDVPYEHEVEVGERLNQSHVLSLIPANLKDKYHYIVMKSHLRQNKFKAGLKEALKIPAGSDYYVKAQYGAAVAEYVSGDLKGSLERQKSLKAYMKKNGISDKNVYSLVNLNLARFGFQQKQLNLSISNYREIDKSHPLWIEALQEQGWAQLLNGDEPGAIGNMHSLHSPYFKGVYMPVTFSIRSIGYLNLCHYGDAYRSLQRLEQGYNPLRTSIASYLKKVKSNTKVYDTVFNYLKKRQKEVDGLPETIIREVARRRDFLNIQEHLNTIVDETEQYSFINSLIVKDVSRANSLKARSKQTIKELQAKIKQADKNEKLKQYVGIWQNQIADQKEKLAFYDFRNETFEEGRHGFKKYKDVSMRKLTTLTSDLRAKAGSKIKEHLAKMDKEMKELFRNNEFLRYEVFAGSGQNIRFQAAGGKAEQKRLPSSAIPKGEDFKWNYDGEFWEDEVGYYRSNLKSNCPERH